MITVRCPKCKHTMKTDPKNIADSRKRCVYCGKSFKVKDHIANVSK